MISLSDADKFIIECIVDFIARNPTKEQTNKKLFIAFCEHLVNMTSRLDYKMEPTLCNLTKGYVYPFTDRLTKTTIFLCLRCKAIHSFQQVRSLKETMDNEDSSKPTGNSEA